MSIKNNEKKKKKAGSAYTKFWKPNLKQTLEQMQQRIVQSINLGVHQTPSLHRLPIDYIDPS